MFCPLLWLSAALTEHSVLPGELKDKAAADGVEVGLESFPYREGDKGFKEYPAFS